MIDSIISQSIRSTVKQHPILAALFTAFVILCVHQYFNTRSVNAGEPPLIRGLPFIGIAFSLLDPHAFLINAQKKHGDVFSVLLFGIKTHVILDPIRGIPAVLKNSKTLSFRETEPWIDDCFFDYPASITQNDDFEFLALEKIVKPHLVGTAGLEEMSESYLNALRLLLNQELSKLKESDDADGWVKFDDLFTWSRSILFQASSTALFGPEFPMQCCEDYWTFEANLFKFLTLPQFLISSAVKSRNKLVSTVAEAIARHGGFPGASQLVKDRVDLSKEFGYTDASIAKTELDILFALQANASPMAYWVLLHLITDPVLSLRLQELADSSDLTNGDVVKIAKLPELNHIFKEALRMHSHAPIIRKVMSRTKIPIADKHSEGGVEDIFVDAGTYVVIPTPTVHFSDLNYPDPDVFDPSRWADQASVASEKDAGRPAAVNSARQQLVSFGGGSHYCPGRFFARIEILSFAIFFYKMFEVESPESVKMASGWRTGAYAQGTQLPVTKTPIVIRQRKT